MKKRFWLICLICLVMVLTTSAMAAEMTTHELPGVPVTLDVPSDWLCMTDQTAPDDPQLTSYGLNVEALLQWMEEMEVCFNVIDPDLTFSVDVSVIESEAIKDLDDFSDESLMTMAEIYLEHLHTDDFELEGSFYRGASANYTVLHVHDTTVPGAEYRVIYDTYQEYYSVSICGRSDYPLTAEQEALIRQIADSLYVAPSGKEPPLMGPYTHTGEMNRFTVDVPANWIYYQTEVNADVEEHTFVSAYGGLNGVIVSCLDAYSLFDGAGVDHRTALDFDHFTMEEYADLLGLDASHMHKESLGGRSFYFGYVPVSDIGKPLTYMITMEDGYLYVFRYINGPDSLLYEDYLSFVSSLCVPEIEEPAVETPAPLPSVDKEIEPPDYSYSYDPVAEARSAMIKGVLLTLVVYFCPIMAYRFFIIQEPIPKKKAKKIVIIYGICAFVFMIFALMALDMGSASAFTAVLWSWLDYWIITRGAPKEQKEETPKTPEPSEIPPVQEPKPNTCPSCGHTVEPGHKFCSKCGASLDHNQ